MTAGHGAIDWLARHRGASLALVGAHVAISIALHRPVGDLVLAARDAIGHGAFRGVVIGVALLALLGIAWPLRRSGRHLDGVTRSLVIGAVAAVIGAWIALVGWTSEVVHVPQYAALALPLYALGRRYLSTILWIVLLGTLDELVQFVAGDSLYLDFNDIVLDVVGGALGLALVAARDGGGGHAGAWSTRDLRRSPAVVVALTMLGVTIGAWGAGLVDFYLRDGRAEAPIVLSRRDRPRELWVRPADGKPFHILRPAPTLLLVAGLCAGCAALDARR